ncbi:MAG: Unknown protein [uncultured Sulfurovum sp.]|uniref:Uncharacterized protein n=1 Tax=uncultured Sulfurovum sp. TaxID=269237 RepID=A0A6S6SUL9_9BACT|nr:MAG: Unknown protein [uncultured Sulfurovum sp.]
MLTQYANIETTSFSLSSLLDEDEQIRSGGLFKNETIIMLIEKHFETFSGKYLISSGVKDIQVFKEELKYVSIKDYASIQKISEDLNRTEPIVTVKKIDSFLQKLSK